MSFLSRFSQQVVRSLPSLAWHASMFEEDLLVVDLDVPEAPPGFDAPVADEGARGGRRRSDGRQLHAPA